MHKCVIISALLFREDTEKIASLPTRVAAIKTANGPNKRGGVGWVGEGWVTNWTSRPAEKPQAVRLFVFWGKLKNYLVSDVYTLTDTDERNTNLGFFKATPQVSSLLRNGNVSSQNNTRTSLVWTLHTNFPFRSRLVHQVGTHLPFRPPTVWNTCSMPPFIHPETQ